MSNDRDAIPGDDDIYRAYDFFQEENLRRRGRLWETNPDPSSDVVENRQSYYSNDSRFNSPSFRSLFFNCGEGLQAVGSNETKILAKKTVPSQHAGVLTGFSQFFGACDDMDGITNSVLWGIRINGLPPNDFMDFVGEFSALSNPCQVYFPLIGASTLGTSSVSVGGFVDPNQAPQITVELRATNYYKTSVVLQGRLIGYTFPLAERADEFGAI